MKVQRLESTDGFVVFDLTDADAADGVVRLAPKVLVDGATWLARSMTYRFALFELRRGGASAGINAREGRDQAIAAAVAELAPSVAAGSLVLDPGKGVPPDALDPWREVDPRPAAVVADQARWVALSAVAGVGAVAGEIDGRRVAIEGFDGAGPALAAALVEQGARIVAVATAEGCVERPEGFAADELAAAWQAEGPGLVGVLGASPSTPAAVLGVDADVLFVGSKAGVVDHGAAAAVSAAVVVPSGPVPVTAKALAVLQRAGTLVLPDFLTTAGPSLAAWAAPASVDDDARRAVVVEAVTAVGGELRGGADGPLLAACHRAEAFLATWQDTLPFGRPLA
ncbi:MAG: Glu/Leu/Phe/Val dehydrogenase dimerization domain-containing protein [Acidimicrobiales bacterium]